MLDFAEITLQDKELFDLNIKQHNVEASEFNFTSFFMWRGYYNYGFTKIRDLICGIAVPGTLEPFAFMPIGKTEGDAFDEVISKLKDYFRIKGWQLMFRGITESELPFFRKHVSSDNDVVFDRNDSDYLYLSENLIGLKGKKYDGKRNHINKFKKKFIYEYVTVTEDLLEECTRIMLEWCEEKKCDDHKGLYCERLANTELLNNYARLGCKGALIKVNDRFEAFTIGEILNEDTAVIHIEKANSKINGLYPFINQQFCEREWSNVRYINREQDVGLEPLRKAKLSYHPYKIVNKYNVYIR